jgi:TP901 family phage tail tape measure protein
MAELATLEFRVDTQGLLAAQRRLDELRRSAGQAGDSSDRLGRDLGDLGQVSGSLTKSISSLVLGVAALGGGLYAGISGARQLSAATAELSTLLDDANTGLDEMTSSARSLAIEFGTSSTQQVQGFYQAVSAGATSASQAIDVLTSANRLAVGGVTDVTTGVDILTTATNVYKDSGLSAADASDALFVAMRAGKTTITELSSYLGKVLPIASNLGVTFDETAAAVAALTKGGIATAESVTGLRAALTAVLGPSQQAQQIAEKLGIDFSTAGLKAKGFAGFMADVVKRTGGSSEAMQTLFSSVEAVTAALALSGSAGESMGEILDDMTKKAGATDAAVDKVTQALNKRLDKVLNKLSETATSVGEKILDVLVPAGEKLIDNIQIISGAATVLAGVMVSRLASSISTVAIAFAAQAVGSSSALAGLRLMAVVAPLTAARLAAVAVSTRALSAALAVFGGPVGLAITALAGGIYYLSTRQTDAEKAAEEHTKAIDLLNVAIAKGTGLSEESAEKTNKDAIASVEAAQAKLEQLKAQRFLNAEAEKLANKMSEGGALNWTIDITSDVDKEIAQVEDDLDVLRRKMREFNKVSTDEPLVVVTDPATDDLDELTDKIKDVIDALKFERDQLGRTDREQAVYTALKRAGIDASNDNASAVRNAATSLFDLKLSLEAAEKAQKDYNDAVNTEQKGWESIDELVASLTRQRKEVNMLAKDIEKLNAVREVERMAKDAGIPSGSLDDTIQKVEDEIDARYRLQQLKDMKNTDFGIGQVGGMNEYGTIGDTGPFNDLARYDQQLTALQQAENNKLDVVRSAMDERVITEQEGQDRITQIQAAATKQRDALMAASNSAILIGSSQMFGDLATIAQGFAGEQSGIYKAMFVVSKAFAIADGILKVQQGIANAMSLPWPMNLAAAASTAAAGASIIANIQSVQATGFKNGGMITGSGTGRSDSIPIAASNGEFIVNAQATKKNRGALEAMNSGKSSAMGGINITIQDYAGAQYDVQQISETDVVIIAKRVSKETVREDAPQVIAADLQNPNSRTSKALNNNTNATRKRA